MGASRYLVGLVFSGFLAVGCTAGTDESVDVEDYDLDLEAAAVPAPAAPPNSTCALIQRGVAGQVFDTDIALGNGANYAMGWYPLMKSGLSSTDHWSAIRFDFAGVVPAGKVVNYAAFNVSVGWNDKSATVNVHRIKFPWSETTATWNNFGGTAAWDAAILGSFDGAGNGFKTVEITGLVQDWYAGNVANNGILLEEPPVKVHGYMTSENSVIEKRPSLWVCWTDPPPPPVCGAAGDACDTVADCCDDLLCNNGTCGGPVVACGQPQAQCGPGLPACCSGLCNEGKCPGGGGGGPVDECDPVGTMCSANSDCCTGSCWDGMCIASTCTVVVDSGDACSPGACCQGGGHCVAESSGQNVCYDAEVLTCVAPGAACDPFNDFCCWGKTCGDDGTCQ